MESFAESIAEQMKNIADNKELYSIATLGLSPKANPISLSAVERVDGSRQCRATSPGQNSASMVSETVTTGTAVAEEMQATAKKNGGKWDG